MDVKSEKEGFLPPYAQEAVRLPSVDEVLAAHRRIEGDIIRTPLVKLNHPGLLQVGDDDCGMLEIYLKLENQQHCQTFKTRGAVNFVKQRSDAELANGLVTPSVGSFGQGLAWYASQRGARTTVAVPDITDAYRRGLLNALGATVHPMIFPEWWMTLESRQLPPTVPADMQQALFVHPASTDCIAGDSTIAVEILQDLPDVDAVVVPYCTGGFSSGMGNVLKALKPGVRLVAAEVATSTPLTTALSASQPSQCGHAPSFANQIGGESVLPFMWPNVSSGVISGTVVVSLEEVAEAIGVMNEGNGVIAEGAGATPVAAAMRGKAGHGKVACVITGGNINGDMLSQIMRGHVPQVPQVPTLPAM